MGDFVERVRHGRTGAKDRMGNWVIGEVSRVPTRARLEQVGSREDDTDAYVVDQWRAFFPAGFDLKAADIIEHRGRKFTVEGTPELSTVPGFPAADHVGAILRYVGEL